MKVSVIMSAYNAADSIENSIKSILSQSYENFEFLICNDGSIDRTNAILTKYSQEDSRIKLYSNVRNIGLTKSLNILINNSTGKVIARQDADDISFPHRLEVQLAYIKNEEVNFKGTLLSIDGTKRIDVTRVKKLGEHHDIANFCANFVIERGGNRLMDSIKQSYRKTNVYSSKSFTEDQRLLFHEKVKVESADFIKIS